MTCHIKWLPNIVLEKVTKFGSIHFNIKKMLQWIPVNTDTQGTRRSVRIIWVSVLSGLSENCPGHMFYRYKDLLKKQISLRQQNVL